MKWISVKDRLPENGQQVLVIGYKISELGGRSKNKSIGLVDFESIDYSSCSDYCYYDIHYSDIEYWQPIDNIIE